MSLQERLEIVSSKEREGRKSRETHVRVAPLPIVKLVGLLSADASKVATLPAPNERADRLCVVLVVETAALEDLQGSSTGQAGEERKKWWSQVGEEVTFCETSTGSFFINE